MAQDKIKMNNTVIRQPDTGLAYNFETTYTSDTTRSQNGTLYAPAVFTVESLGYTATGLTKSEMSQILQIIAHGEPFSLHYFSPYYGAWKTNNFYVGKGSLSIGALNEADETFDELSFNMIGISPI